MFYVSRLLALGLLAGMAACSGSSHSGYRSKDNLYGHTHVISYLLEHIVADAERIARVRIVKTSYPLTTTYPYAPDRNCGLLVEAEVVESFKGGNENFQFLMVERADFRGVNREYLAIVLPKQPWSDELFAFGYDLLTEEENLRISCRQSVPLHTPGGFRTVWAIESQVGASGIEWLEADTRPAVNWEGEELLDKPSSLETRSVTVGASEYKAISWRSARERILAIVSDVGTLAGPPTD